MYNNAVLSAKMYYWNEENNFVNKGLNIESTSKNNSLKGNKQTNKQTKKEKERKRKIYINT